MSTSVRRGEAHLWLLLEEAIVAVTRGGTDPLDAQWHFREVADAMAIAGVLPTAITQALKHELDDALVVRLLIPAASFSGGSYEVDDDLRQAHHGPVDGAPVWLEAEIERHLDVLAGYDPATRPDPGADTLRILAAPARAFEAAGVLGAAGKALLADLAASIAAAGFDPGRATPGDGRVRRDWVRFLRDRPGPIPEPFEPTKSVRPRAVLGTIGDRTVRVDEVAWNEHAVELTVAVHGTDTFAPDLPGRVAWQARAVDPRGRLHLGQPSRSYKHGGTAATLRLRPGLEDGVSSLQVRITSHGRKVEGQVHL
jgi:hypothetical protein